MDLPKSKTPCRRKMIEAERRKEFNEKFAVLETLVAKDSDLKMSQADILKATHRAAVKIKNISARGPYCRGFNDGFGRIESLALLYMKSLNLSRTTEKNQISKIRKFFELTLENFFSSSSKSENISETGADADRTKQTNKQKEQNRRDCHLDSYHLLKTFISENDLCDPSRLQRIQILDIMISFMNKAANATLPGSPVELKLYLDGLEYGKRVGKASLIKFLEKEPFLMAQTGALQKFMELQLGSTSSSTPPSSIAPAPIAPLPLVQFNPHLIFQLPLLFPNLFKIPVLQIPSPTGSVVSPSLSETSSSPDEKNNSVTEDSECASGIFRPW